MKALLRLLLIVCLFLSRAFSEEFRGPTISEMKAAMLYHLALFTEWPKTHLDNAFHLCLYGSSDPFGIAIEPLAKYSIHGLPVQIERPQQLQDISNCDLLYITSSASSELGALLAITRDKPILTITDQPVISQDGLIITIGFENQKIIFDINLTAAKIAKLYINTKLLRLAHQVN